MEISPEQTILLLFARQILESEHRAHALRLLEQNVSWSHLTNLASWHRLSGLVHEHLTALAPDLIPDEITQRRLTTTARNLMFQAETERLVGLLNREGMEVVLLKGMALLNSVYRESGLREMSDIDLLVREKDIVRANQLLQASGYVVAPPHRDPAVSDRMTKEHHHYPALLREDGQVVVELHRHVLREGHPLRFSIEGFWNRAEATSLGQQSALVPGPPDQVMHVAVHFFLNRRYRSAGALGQLCDISETLLVHERTMDWRILIEYAELAPVAGPLYCALFAVERLLGTSIPDSVADEIRPSGFPNEILEPFLEYRVLRAEPWLPVELLRPAKHPLRRAFPARSRLVLGETGLIETYLRRGRMALRLLLDFLLHPRQVLRDLRLNRLLRSLYENGTD